MIAASLVCAESMREEVHAALIYSQEEPICRVGVEFAGRGLPSILFG
jgi:hypothetical protein